MKQAGGRSLEPGAGLSLEFPQLLRRQSSAPLLPLRASWSSRGPPGPQTEAMRATMFSGPLRLIEAVRTFPNGLSREEEDRGGAEGEGCGGCEG